MLDLISIEEIKPIKDDIRCRTCLKFNTILHASDIWEIKDNNFVRLEIPTVSSCHLIENICKGSLLRLEDYEIIEACDKYALSGDWPGINKTFITIINGIIEYLYIVENKTFDRETILVIAKTLDDKTVSSTSAEAEVNNKDIRTQFQIEFQNYKIMEAVRSGVHDT